jgi:hypothetical protein
MGTYTNPGRTSRSRRAQAGAVFNPAADILSAIEGAEEQFVERKRKVNLFEEQAAQRNEALLDAVRDTRRMDDSPFTKEMTDQFTKMVDDLYKLDISSFEGDRAEYVKKSKEAQRLLSDFPKIMGQLNDEAQKYQSLSVEEKNKQISRSKANKEYLDFVNDPSNMGMRIEGGDLIITNNGEDLFNGTGYLNSRKDGFELAPYTFDYTDQIEAAADEAFDGIEDLTLVDIEKVKKGQVLEGTKKENYEKAIEAYATKLRNSSKIDALVNESTFQRFVQSSDIYNSNKDTKVTKEAMIEFLVNDRFPGGKEVLRQRSKTPVTDTRGRGKQGSKVEDFSDWIKENIREKRKETRYHDSPREVTDEFEISIPEQRKRMLNKIRQFDTDKFVYGIDDRVKDALGDDADTNKLYRLEKIPQGGRFNAFEVIITDEDLKDDKVLNKILIDNNIKFNKSSVL